MGFDRDVREDAHCRLSIGYVPICTIGCPTTRQFSDRIHFLHLRSTELLSNGDFYEAWHLGGKGQLLEVIKIMLDEQKRRQQAKRTNYRLSFRVDHGHRMLSDFDFNYNPGYPLLGRMKALSEVTGMMYALAC
jgi:mannonate dehydratase